MTQLITAEDLAELLDKACARSVKQRSRGKKSGIDGNFIQRLLDDPYLGEYQRVRAGIQAFQAFFKISGIVPRKVCFRNKELIYPDVNSQLITLDGDKEILMEAKESVVSWFLEVTQGMELWKGEESDTETTTEEILNLASAAEWAYVFVSEHEVLHSKKYEPGDEDNPDYKIFTVFDVDGVKKFVNTGISSHHVEVTLSLCWGDPDTYMYVEGKGYSQLFVATPKVTADPRELNNLLK
ncbi:hypothetical protein [Chroococcidiopsis thermalis]|uniref:Uncharacterized protein n=1 Tax=Chroococcidiopsis thermalis (strain PCC 7203) TaxID=251229 RepID=K9TVV0_CHRTP|nr:hypothetical protein [Chroococcidiopsis thermalis]AFY86695.1 hypothetical protein Chro_1167 [Chroococcidiopsis thermalis PCC 7203]